MADEREVNPYESPRAAVDDAQTTEAAGFAWRQGNTACIRDGDEFPRCCVYCATSSRTVRIPYRQIWVGVGSGIFRHRTAYWVCRRHRMRQGFRRIVEGAMIVLVVTMIPAVAFQARVSSAGALSLLVELVAVSITAKLLSMGLRRWTGSPISLSSQDGRILELAGCGEAFLASLPTREEVERDG